MSTDLEDHPDIDDPGEYNQRQRLQEIAEARKNARQALAEPAFDVDQSEYRIFVAKNVQALAAELEWLVRDNGDRERYFEEPLGPVTIQPPTREEFKDQLSKTVYNPVGDTRPEPKHFEIAGLYTSEETGLGFLDYPCRLSATWQMRFKTKGKKLVTSTIEKQVCLPESVSMSANRLCRQFIYEAGLDAQVEQETDSDPNPV